MFFVIRRKNNLNKSMQSHLKNVRVGVLFPRKSMSTRVIDYQFLQRSKLPTMYFQRSLPRLPIPLLEKTCERFLAGVKPILDKNEYINTQEYVEKFRQNTGMQLQALLKQKDERNKHTSYISDPWFDMYLRDRTPLPLNYNPLVVMKHEQRPEYQEQIVRATNMVISSLRFWRSLQAEILEPEVYHLNPKKSNTPQFRKWMSLMPTAFATYAAYAFKAFPLDMSQYQRLFGVSRIPSLEKDYLLECQDSKHIIIMRRGNLYAVDVLDTEGNILPPNTILSRLQAVVDLDKKCSAAENPVGVLTSVERNLWAKIRQDLSNSSTQNREQLQKVDSALFCLCLDSEEDPKYNEEKPQDLLCNMLAGVGKNRWFDKSISLLIASDGTTAVNFEHSWGDGVAVLRYINEIYEETIKNPFVSTKNLTDDEQDTPNVCPIVFQIDDHICKEISNAIQRNISTMSNFRMDIVKSNGLNKKACKRAGISPDSVMQLSFQLAYRQTFNSYVGTYESCSTAAFRHGRTEAMRPCTMATRNFCESILKPQKTQLTNQELRSMLSDCSKLHGQLTKDAAMGQGFDRHLFALKNIAVEENIPVPDLFSTEAYKKINYNIISTSTLSSNSILAGSFGPVVTDGLGIGYTIQDDECGAIVTSYKNGAKGEEYADSLMDAFNKINRVLS